MGHQKPISGGSTDETLEQRKEMVGSDVDSASQWDYVPDTHGKGEK